MNLIRKISAREILDSRGNPTVEVEIDTDKCIARASVPSGVSTGSHEACELRDGDPKRFHGQGVSRAVENVNTVIRNAFFQLDIDLTSQRDFDMRLIELDGTPQKTTLGANAILGTSLAFAKTKAFSQSVSLYRYVKSLMTVACSIDSERFVIPTPMVNVLEGGAHATSGLEFQEFMIIPADFPTFAEALRAASEVYHSLQTLLHDNGFSITVGDEGGFAPALPDNEVAIQYLIRAIEHAGYKPGQQIFLALDCAASEFYDQEQQRYRIKVRGREELLSTEELRNVYYDYLKQYPLLSIEDHFEQDDWQAFSDFQNGLPRKIQTVGDDLLVTNVERIQKGINLSAINSLLVKLNQVGTVHETVEATMFAQKNHWGTIMSHRGGETEDVYLPDFAIGLCTGQIKTGGMSRGERIIKYNQLLRIEEREGDKAMYAGKMAFGHLR